MDPNIRFEVVAIKPALQEQPGLKLESARGPVEVVVTGTFEKPPLD